VDNKKGTMKLKAQICGEELELVFKQSAEKITAVFDGDRSRELIVRALGAAEYLILDDYHSYRCRVGTSSGAHNTFIVWVRGRSYEIQISDPKRLRSSQEESSHSRGEARILAPMPGKVVRVLLSVGAPAQLGTGILVVEAMKMQNELKSPKAGTVTQLNAKPGDTVNAGDVLAVIE
jgi:biotin carboxyl carrier protein